MNIVKLEEVVDDLILILPSLRKKLMVAYKFHKDSDLSPSHLRIVFLLNNLGSMPVSVLAKRLFIAKPNMTPLIQKLIDKGLVKRVSNEEDRRIINIALTEKGHEYMNEQKQLLTYNLRMKLSSLKNEDLEKLSIALKYMKEVFSKIE